MIKMPGIIVLVILLTQNMCFSEKLGKQSSIEEGMLSVFNEMLSQANKTNMTQALETSQSSFSELFNKTSKDVTAYVNTILTDIDTIEKEDGKKGFSDCLKKTSEDIKLLGFQTVFALKSCEDIAKEGNKGVEKAMAATVKAIGKAVFSYAKKFGECTDLICQIGCISRASRDGLEVSGANANRVTTYMIHSGVKSATCMTNTFKSFLTKIDAIKAEVLSCVKT